MNTITKADIDTAFRVTSRALEVACRVLPRLYHYADFDDLDARLDPDDPDCITLWWDDRGDRECYDLPAGWLVMDDAALDAAVGVVVAARMEAEARASERRAAAKEAEERAALARLRAKYGEADR